MTLTRSLHADIDLLALHRLSPQRYPALLESSASGTEHGRWDVLLLAEGPCLRLDPDGCTRDGAGQVLEGGFLAALDAAWQAERVPHAPASPWPFRGGWAVLLDYELAAQVEPILQLPTRTDGLPTALALRAPAAVLRDRLHGHCVALAEPGREELLQQIGEDIAACAALPPLPAWAGPLAVDEDAPERFTAAVERVLDYLRAGDVFQANISRAWHAAFAAVVDPAALHARLRAANPAPFAGLFVAAGRAVASSSPERLVSVQGDVVQTRPIAG
ncbi:chorismate-binding protein, partial [Xanthomonas perforans]